MRTLAGFVAVTLTEHWTSPPDLDDRSARQHDLARQRSRSPLVRPEGVQLVTGVQLQLKALLVQIGAPDLALVPTSLPAHYAFESLSVTGSRSVSTSR